MAKKPNPLLKGIPSKADADAKPDAKVRAGAKGRDGKRLIGGHFDPKVTKALKQIALDDDTTVQALVGEALTLLFQKKNVKVSVE